MDAALVERLGIRLFDEAKLNVWLDRWVLVPGEYWQQKMAKALIRHDAVRSVSALKHPRDGSGRR